MTSLVSIEKQSHSSLCCFRGHAVEFNRVNALIDLHFTSQFICHWKHCDLIRRIFLKWNTRCQYVTDGETSEIFLHVIANAIRV